jgi:hypothetical protein
VVFDLQDHAMMAEKASVSKVRTMAPWLEGIGPGAHHHCWIARYWTNTYDYEEGGGDQEDKGRLGVAARGISPLLSGTSFIIKVGGVVGPDCR